MKKAVIFDLDGTLANTIESLTYCGNRALRKFGLPEFEEADYKYFVGDGAAVLVRRALDKAGDTGLIHFQEVFEEYSRLFEKDCMYHVKPYEGIRELLEELKKRQIRIAVLSNKAHENSIQVVETLFGAGYFDWVQGQMDGVPKKPDPAGVYQIQKKLGLPKEAFLYMGDTSVDMKTGKAAGMFTVGVLWGFRDRQELEENHADVIIERPAELLSLL